MLPFLAMSKFLIQVGDVYGCHRVLRHAGVRKRKNYWLVECVQCRRQAEIHTATLRARPSTECRVCYRTRLKLEYANKRQERQRLIAEGRSPKFVKRVPSQRSRERRKQVVHLRDEEKYGRGTCQHCPRPRDPGVRLCELHRAIARQLARIRRLELAALTAEERRTRPSLRGETRNQLALHLLPRDGFDSARVELTDSPVELTAPGLLPLGVDTDGLL